jgi:hypothetical protein
MSFSIEGDIFPTALPEPETAFRSSHRQAEMASSGLGGRTLIRRSVVTTLAVVVAIMAGANPASATCLFPPFDGLVHSSETIWWATVTTSAPVIPPGQLGGASWMLTVHILRVLKGPGTEGGTATVSIPSCVGPQPPSAIRDQAPWFVGRTELFVGTGRAGVLEAVPLTGLSAPQGLSPEQQYRRVLSDLKLVPLPVTHRSWLPLVAAACGVILLLGLVLLLLRRRQPPLCT